jgi:Rrf2 family transcriptional regulator, iron-sulfur cluster assembly transcription factor
MRKVCMLNNKTHHAINVMVAVASSPAGTLVTTLMLSKRLGLSVSYLENILRLLREGGLVQSTRGPGGGYSLARAADDISVWDVVQLAEASLEATDVGAATAAAGAGQVSALVQDFETTLHAVFADYLSGRRISEFAVLDPALQPVANRSTSPFRLAPMPPRFMPVAPNSVFELSAFSHRFAA